MYGGSLAYLIRFETGGKYNRRKIHRYGRFGGGIEDLFLTVVITFFVILRISKNVIIFLGKKTVAISSPPLSESYGLSIPTGKLMFSAKFFKPISAVKIRGFTNLPP